MITHQKSFGIYHWDTFDNETLLIGQENTLKEAQEFVTKHYGSRLRVSGADRVDIVNKSGKVVSRYSVG